MAIQDDLTLFDGILLDGLLSYFRISRGAFIAAECTSGHAWLTIFEGLTFRFTKRWLNIHLWAPTVNSVRQWIQNWCASSSEFIGG
jgi:hypothetical protein